MMTSSPSSVFSKGQDSRNNGLFNYSRNCRSGGGVALCWAKERESYMPNGDPSKGFSPPGEYYGSQCV